MKKCPYCAEQIQDEAIVCRYCGRDLIARPPVPVLQAAPIYVPPQPAKRKSRISLLAVAVIGGLCAALCCVAIVFAPSVSQFSQQTQVAMRGTPTPINPDDFAEIDVRELEKNPEEYSGRALRLEGQVFNIDETGNNTFIQMWVRYPGGNSFDRVAVVVNYSDNLPGVYEDSDIVVYGRGDGSSSGLNALGGTTTQPRIRAELIELDE